MIQHERVQFLNEEYVRRGRYVLYWMQQSQRASANHALEYAIREADRLNLPVVALFGITQRFPDAQLRHYAFMLEGLAGVAAALRERGIRLVVRAEPPPKALERLAPGAALVVTDRGYLRVQRRWRKQAASLPCRVAQVESDVVVPVDVASEKEEYAARTLRPKIHRRLDRFLAPLEETDPERSSLGMRLGGIDVSKPDRLLGRLRLARRAAPVGGLRGGEIEAGRRLKSFLEAGLRGYADRHSEPALDAVSHLSPYLHFGQISPLAIALAVRRSRRGSTEDRDAFLEELIVRRELAMNFCHRNDAYDTYACVPSWARETLAEHRGDRRPYLYTLRDLERARTHDPYWNAAQLEMVHSGFMHGYMRMYWGKKIIEWSSDPESAFRSAITLNNRYELDGRDPNSFAGVAWCFGKHDRPWTRRPIFGSVRWMSASGLERKFDMDGYVSRVEKIVAGDGEDPGVTKERRR